MIYEEGQDVPQDHQKAVELFTLAASQGFPSAQCNLGFMYQKGEGVPQDDRKAFELYLRQYLWKYQMVA